MAIHCHTRPNKMLRVSIQPGAILPLPNVPASWGAPSSRATGMSPGPIAETMARPRGLLPSIDNLSYSKPSSLPPPPPAGQDSNLQYWFAAKCEEDRRVQQEQKTHQESLRLEQRRIEQQMLSEAVKNGIPPDMIPMIFSGVKNNENMHGRNYAAQPTPMMHYPHVQLQQIHSGTQRTSQQVPSNNVMISSGANYPSRAGSLPPQPVEAPYQNQGPASSQGPIFSTFSSNPGSTRSDRFHQQPPSMDFHHWSPPERQHSQARSARAQPDQSVLPHPPYRTSSEIPPNDRKRKSHYRQNLNHPPHVRVVESTANRTSSPGSDVPSYSNLRMTRAVRGRSDSEPRYQEAPRGRPVLRSLGHRNGRSSRRNDNDYGSPQDASRPRRSRSRSSVQQDQMHERGSSLPPQEAFRRMARELLGPDVDFSRPPSETWAMMKAAEKSFEASEALSGVSDDFRGAETNSQAGTAMSD